MTSMSPSSFTAMMAVSASSELLLVGSREGGSVVAVIVILLADMAHPMASESSKITTKGEEKDTRKTRRKEKTEGTKGSVVGV